MFCVCEFTVGLPKLIYIYNIDTCFCGGFSDNVISVLVAKVCCVYVVLEGQSWVWFWMYLFR